MRKDGKETQSPSYRMGFLQSSLDRDGGSRGRSRYFLSLPNRAVFISSFMFFGSPEG